MSENKFRYYTVITTSVVRAESMTAAEQIARGRRGVAGKVLATETESRRVSAGVANTLVQANS